MSAERPHKDGTGVLYSNNPAKKKSERSPDAGGECTIAGKRYRIAGWRHESTNGNGMPWLSLAFTPAKEDQNAPS